MAAGSSVSTELSEEATGLTTAGLWKGENDSDAEQMEAYDANPLANAGAWTEKEAHAIYREKLVYLRTLYTNQLACLKHSLAERRREFLLEWMAAGGDREDAVNPSRGGTHEDSAYRSYRRRSGEEAVLERRQKQRQIAASVEFFSRKDVRLANHAHHQHLTRLQSQYMPTPQPTCSNMNCENKCLPLASKCRRHICADPKQLLYTSCVYVYPSGAQCMSPVAVYMDPPLCGGHCDMAISMQQSASATSVSVDTPRAAESDESERVMNKETASSDKNSAKLAGEGVEEPCAQDRLLETDEECSLSGEESLDGGSGGTKKQTSPAATDSTVSVIVNCGSGVGREEEEREAMEVVASGEEKAESDGDCGT